MSKNPSEGSRGMPAKLRKVLFFLVLAALPLAALYTWTTLAFSYAQGEHAGYIARVSRRGWLCKTWEGELDVVPMPGAATEKFYFSVRDDETAHRLETLVGRQVRVQYSRHRGVPSSCFGESEFFVSGATPVEEPGH